MLVEARRRDGHTVLEVADEGPGIAAADRARVFERFTTGGARETDGGTGLGLAIARWVTQLHGGTDRGRRPRRRADARAAGSAPPFPDPRPRSDLVSSPDPSDTDRRLPSPGAGSTASSARSGPSTRRPRDPPLVLAALGVGLLAALVLPFRAAGLGTFVVLAAACGGGRLADARPADAVPRVLGGARDAARLDGPLRDALWVVALCLLAAVAVGVVALAGARSVAALALSALVVPLAGLRGLPWLGALDQGPPDRRRLGTRDPDR